MMGAGICVHVFDVKRNTAVVAGEVFYDLPVRIGRDSRLDIGLDEPFVSTLHVTLDIVSNQVTARDENSKNGVLLGNGGGRMVAGKMYSLTAYGNTFAIAHLLFTVSTVNTENRLNDADRQRGGLLLSGRVGHTPPLADHRPAPAVSPTARDALAATKAAHDAVATATAYYRELLFRELEALPPQERAQFVRSLAVQQPESLNDATFQARATNMGLATSELRPPETMRVEDASHRVLQELAAWYGVPTSISTLSDVIRFARKLQDVLDALFSSILPLRDGLKRFGLEFGVDHGSAQSELMRRLDRARTEKEVAATLLGSLTPTDDSWLAVRKICADYMVHSLGMTHACMQGVSSLLAELSPGAIMREVQKTATWAKRAFPHRALWEAFERRHSDFAPEENETFRHVFGVEFAGAYNRVFADGAAQEVKHAQRRQRQPVLAGKSQVAEQQSADAMARAGGAPVRGQAPRNGTIVAHDRGEPARGRAP